MIVNFAAAALLGSCLGFLPWNLSEKRKIFMGDGGALLIGATNLADHVAVNASQMLSNNYLALIEHLWDKEAKALKIDPADEILSGCLLTHGGEVVHPQFREPTS